MYSHDTDTILDLFTKAYESAHSNYEAASALSKIKQYSQSTSLAILALEEVGKMILVDGLLFAREGDERYKHHKKGHLSHKMKLDALEIYPLFLGYLSYADPRQHEKKYKQMMVIVITDLKEKRQKIADLFGDDFLLMDLDILKQQGFYSHTSNGKTKSNREGVSPEIAKSILDLTWRVTDTLKFVLGPNLVHYRNQFRDYREKIDDITLRKFRNNAKQIAETIFGKDD